MRTAYLPGVIAGLGVVLSVGGWEVSTVLRAAGAGPVAGVRPAMPPAPTPPDPLPGEGLRTTAVRHYRMDGRIRPLLFWFGKDDIGLARITWRDADGGTRGYEMLVGTDPSKAPRAMNKWGFISEQVSGGDGRLLALMTGSDAADYEEAAADVEKAAAGGDFRAILGQVHAGASAWKTARISTANAFSIHDVDSALDRIRLEAAGAQPREQAVAAGVRPGFLVALADLIDRGAGQLPGSPAARALRQQPVRYVFGQGTYDMWLRSSALTDFELDGRPRRVVRSSFEIRTLASDARTRFDLLFATEPGLATVPVAAEWQPRWWLKVELRLQHEGA